MGVTARSAFAAVLLAINLPSICNAAPIIDIDDTGDGVPVVTATGIPVGIPGIKVTNTAPESITFTYDDLVPAAASRTRQVMLTEPGLPSSQGVSDKWTWSVIQGASVETVTFFSDTEGTVLPPFNPCVSNPDPFLDSCDIAVENGGLQTMFTVPVTGTVYRVRSDISDISGVPEPPALVLLGTGLLALCLLGKRRFIRNPWLNERASRIASHPIVAPWVAIFTIGILLTRINTVAADPAPLIPCWPGWEQVGVKTPTEPRGKMFSAPAKQGWCPAGTTPTPDWTSQDNGQSCATPTIPPQIMNAPSLCEEGPYLRSQKIVTGFRLTINYQSIKGRVTPIKRNDATMTFTPGNPTNQDFANSGVYIFDRYEVQIIDPRQFVIPFGGVSAQDDQNHPGGQIIKPVFAG